MKQLINYVIEKYQDFMTSLKPKQTTMATNDGGIANESLLLESRLKGAIQFLKTTQLTRQNKPIYLNNFPWYMLIGQSESGKSSLLANSNLNFILEKSAAQQGVKGVTSNQCDWWVTQELVLIDVPGSFTTLKTRKLSHANKLWHAFINYMVKWRGKDALSGVILTISLPELMQRQMREQLIDSLKYQISFLKDKLGADLPFYITLTKCDLIPGFTDFFGDSSTEELSQAWGVPFLEDNVAVEDAFITRFNTLIKRLNKQLIWRLHQERNPRAKVYIKDFPLQVERVKEALYEVIQALARSNAGHCHIKGIYLTSALQPTYEEDSQQSYPQTVSGDAFQQSLQIMKNPEIPRQSYFIKQFFMQALPSVRAQNQPVSFPWILSTASMAVFLLVAVIVGKSVLINHSQSASQIGIAQTISTQPNNQSAMNATVSNSKLT